MKVTSMASAHAALKAFHDAAIAGEGYRLILVDYMMPDVDGFSLVQQIRQLEITPQPTVIIVSSAVAVDHTARCKELGIERYLLKPIVQSDLRVAILGALGATTDLSQDSSPVEEAIGNIKQLRILLAEDGKVNQRVAVGLLEKRGHLVTVANNGKEAFDRYRQERFDLVFMDLQMPEMDGLEATAAIRQHERAVGKSYPYHCVDRRRDERRRGTMSRGRNERLFNQAIQDRRVGGCTAGTRT